MIVETQFVIESSGRVKAAKITDAGGADEETQDCVLRVIKESTFDRFTASTMLVNLPIKLR